MLPPVSGSASSGAGSSVSVGWLRLNTHALAHIDGADGAIRIDGPRLAFFRAGAHRLFHASGLRRSQKISLIHHAEKVGFVLFALFVHGLVIVDDDIERVAAAGLDGNKLLVGVLVIKQIAGHKVALFGKALAGLNGGLRGGSFLRHGGIAVVRALAAVRIGIRRDAKAA